MGGARIGRRDSSNDVIYYFSDHLGTSRVNAQVLSGQLTATLCYDADFYPYGGEDDFTNTCPQNYKFQSKERDTETGNDDFGARYYSWRLGRWLSADWSAVPEPVPYANLTNPQTLNLYAMVRDNPDSFADLDGHFGSVGQYAANADFNASSSCGAASDSSCAGAAWTTNHGDLSANFSGVDNAELLYYEQADAEDEAKAQQQNTSTTSKIIKKIKAGAQAVKKAYAAEQKWVKSYPEVVAAAAILGAVLGGGEGPEPEGEVPGEVGTPEEGAAPTAGEVNVSFGHGARHLEGTGLSPDAVEAAIRGQVQGATSGASE